jgi:hypothetical protein
MASKIECPVCVETTNGRNKEIKCVHCEYSCCTECCKTYILGSVNDPKCMSCTKEWSREFMSENFTNSFITKEYKKHRENTLYDRQISMLQETQIVAERRKQVETVAKEIRDIDIQMKELKIKKRKLENDKWRLKNGHAKVEEKEMKEKFFGHCPQDNCRGFINKSWNCGICETKVCKTCKENINDIQDHICDPNVVLSVRALKAESKPCPKCKVPIFKISGCKQMWCVVCHVAFDYHSGEIVRRGTVHNPHFIEWQKQQGGNFVQNNNACGRDRIPDTNFYALIHPFHHHETAEYFHYFNRFLNHCHHVERENYNVDMNNYDIGAYLELRIDLLLNKITEKDFKTKVQRNEKKIHKKYDIMLIVDMFVETGRDILDQSFRKKRTFTGNIKPEELKKSVKLVENLILYTNESLKNVSKIYKNKVPQIKTETKTHNRYQGTARSGKNYTEFEFN